MLQDMAQSQSKSQSQSHPQSQFNMQHAARSPTPRSLLQLQGKTSMGPKLFGVSVGGTGERTSGCCYLSLLLSLS